MPTYRVVPFENRHVVCVAQMHIEGIDTGFLSSLGPKFVRELYAAIAVSPHAFGYVVEDSGRVLGFIVCATHVGRVYRTVLLRRGWRLAMPLVRFAASPRVIRKVFQTLLYPVRKRSAELPHAEILSVVVAAEARRRGMGVMLMQAALDGFRQRKCRAVRVAVGAANEPANRYYLGAGFRLAETCENHGIPMNIYVCDLAS